MNRALVTLPLLLAAIGTAATVEIRPTSPSIRYFGRALATDSATYQWSWSGSGVELAFNGTSCSIHLKSKGIYKVVVDGVVKSPLDLTTNSDSVHLLAAGLPVGNHLVEVRQKTEARECTSRFRGFRIDGAPAKLPPPASRRIAFYGNSIACGYGILDSLKTNGFSVKTEDEGRTFAALAADSLRAERNVVCWSGRGVIQNYYGPDTLEPTLPRLIDRILPTDGTHLWNASNWKPDVVVVELGTNDFSHAAPESTRFRTTFAALLDTLHKRHPNAPFVLVDGPMMSDYYPPGIAALTTLKRHLDTIVAAAGRRGIQATHLSLTPNDPARGYGADWHPNQAQARLNGQELANHLRKVMGWTGR